MDETAGLRPEFDDPRPPFRLARLGFTLSALALGLQCLSTAGSLAVRIFDVRALRPLLVHPGLSWGVGAAIPWAALLGSFFLWRRWSGPLWGRWAGILVAMQAADVASWFLEHLETFGLPQPGPGLDWARLQISGYFQWGELALLAALAGDLAARIGDGAKEQGRREPLRASRAAIGLAGLGGIFWTLVVLGTTDWAAWPPRLLLIRDHWTFQNWLMSTLLLAITDFQVTVLCLLAGRRCGRRLADLDRAESGHELLRSRSETEGWPWN